MNKFNTQVSPGNRVDFSKIRKVAQGSKIQKFLTPAGEIENASDKIKHGVTFVPGTTWNEFIYKRIEDALHELFTENISNERKQELVNEINLLQTDYAKIASRYPTGSLKFDQDVKDYQLKIIKDFNFINTEGIQSGLDETRRRYNIESSNPNTGDNPGNDNWKSSADGIYQAMTMDRHALGYGDDWDENSPEYKENQDKWKKHGLEVYKDVDNAYKLRLLSTDTGFPVSTESTPFSSTSVPAETTTATANSEATSPESTVVTTSTQAGTTAATDGTSDQTTKAASKTGAPEENTRKVLEYANFPKRKGSPWTDWFPLSIMLGNNLTNNLRFFNDEVKKKFPLQEAPYLQGKVTNNYAARQIRNLQMADIRSRAQRLLGSDMTLNQAYLQEVELNLQPFENQNAIDLTNEFNQTSLNLQEIENENKITGVEVANNNRVQNTAAFNSILAARQRRNANLAAELNSYIGYMASSHGKWLQNERMEDSRYNREINDYNYQTELYALYESSGLKKLEGGIQNSGAFNTLREQILHDRSIKDILVSTDGTITDLALLEYIETHPDNPYVKQAIEEYQKELNAATSRFEHEKIKLDSERTRKNIGIPVTVTTNGTRFGDNYIRHSTYLPSSRLYGYKSGGRVSRFIDYMNHYQRQQLFDKKETRRALENLYKKLARDLGYLDKETLMLLKLIFK